MVIIIITIIIINNYNGNRKNSLKRPYQYYISIQISGKSPAQFKILRNHIQFSV